MPDDVDLVIALATRVKRLREDLAEAEHQLGQAMQRARTGARAPAPKATKAKDSGTATGTPGPRGHTGRSERVRAIFADGKEHTASSLRTKLPATALQVKKTLSHLREQGLIKPAGEKGSGTYVATKKLLSGK